MKRFLVLLAVALGTMSYAQKGKQEVSLDVANAIVMKTLQVTYEYNVLDSSTVGMSALINFAGDSTKFKYNEKTMFTPFFRHYFGEGSPINYFGEVFFGINSGTNKTIDYTDLALGVGGGLKYISDGGVTISALGGVGRNMFSEDSYTIVPRAFIGVGYQF